MLEDLNTVLAATPWRVQAATCRAELADFWSVRFKSLKQS